MKSEIKNRGRGRISLYIAGREPLIDVDYPTALEALDKAYTQEVTEIISKMELCATGLDSALTHLHTIRRNIDIILATAKEKHIQERNL